MTENKRAEILRTAEELVNGERAQTYGRPEESFGRIAKLWSAMGFRVLPPASEEHDGYQSREPNAVDVALALTQLKVSRIISSPDHEDSWIDGAGYLALGAEMAVKSDSEKTVDRLLSGLPLPRTDQWRIMRLSDGQVWNYDSEEQARRVYAGADPRAVDLVPPEVPSK